MNRIVVKFGGSNLKSVEDLERIIGTVKRYGEPLIIVVSALYGVTDLLARTLLHLFDHGGEMEKLVGISRLRQHLFDAHMRYIERYVTDEDLRRRAEVGLLERLEELGRCLLGVSLLGTVPPFAHDRVLSQGERFSSLMLSTILRSRGVSCTEMLPEEIGLITDGRFGGATVDIEASRDRVSTSLGAGDTCVIPGFYGISPDDEVTLLGRGGSDYSATAIARCIGATSVDLWKDVPGFLSGDPDLVDDPVRLESLTYEEAAELSYFGARIIHPRAFEPLLGFDIPVRLFDIRTADDLSEAPTIIGSSVNTSPTVIKSVTCSDDVGVLKLRGPGVGIRPGIMAEVAGQLNAAGINIMSILTAQTCINVLLARVDLERSRSIIEQGVPAAVEEITVMEEVSLVAAVGNGMLERAGVWARMAGAIAREGINMHMICAGASDVVAYCIVDRSDQDSAVRAIHREFLGTALSVKGSDQQF